MAADIGSFEVLVISFKIFIAHFHGIENMYDRIGHKNIIFKRGYEIGIELILYALSFYKRHVRVIHAEHIEHFIVIFTFLGRLLFKPLFHEFRKFSLLKYPEKNFPISHALNLAEKPSS